MRMAVLGATGAVGGTFGLGFNTLPVVFAHMGGFGRVIGFIWFFMLFLAAITSSLSMLQPVKAFLHEALDLSYRRATAVLAAVTIPGSLWVIYYSKDLVALDTMDFWVGTVGIFLLATVHVICFSWVFGIDRGLEEAHRGAQMRIPPIYRFILKFVAPAYLLIVFVGFCVQQAPGYAEQIANNSTVRSTLLLVLFVFALLIAATYQGAKRWREIEEKGEIG